MNYAYIYIALGIVVAAFAFYAYILYVLDHICIHDWWVIEVWRFTKYPEHERFFRLRCAKCGLEREEHDEHL